MTSLDADFNASSDGFGYQDDLFNGTSQPSLATGNWTASGGPDGSGAIRVFTPGAATVPDRAAGHAISPSARNSLPHRTRCPDADG